MEFIDEKLAQYANDHSSKESELLYRLNRETHLKVMQPRMLSGHLQGRFLSLISHLVKPELILEIGTYTGYSALCLAEGLAENGKLITIDNNPERDELVKRYIAESDLTGKVIPMIGDAHDLIPHLEGTFDLVFIDADKSSYADYFDLVIDRMRKGGIILSDNVLWSGKVTEPVKSNDQDTRLLLEYNRKLANDPRIETVLLPIRDGISVARRK
ncbi:MAG TPA: O-methyltransferase [Flavobacteriales bacterium]|nr:O-methyltransferase [Flavobacteriales bacterium]HPH82408.1 O-methyltransferase [Flavobacteriales bacterium]